MNLFKLVAKNLVVLFIYCLAFPKLHASSFNASDAECTTPSFNKKQFLSYANFHPIKMHRIHLNYMVFNRANLQFTEHRLVEECNHQLMLNALNYIEKDLDYLSKVCPLYFRLSEIYFDFLYDQSNALKYISKAIEHYQPTNHRDSIYYLEMHEFKSYINIMMRQYDEAIYDCEYALEQLEQMELITDHDQLVKAKLYYNLALVYAPPFLNIPQREALYAEKNFKILRTIENTDIVQLILSYRKMGLYEDNYMNYEKSNQYFNRALNLFNENKEEIRKTEGFKLELSLYRAYMNLLISFRDEEPILTIFNKAKEIAEHSLLDNEEKANYIGILNFMTRYYLIKNNIPEAKHYNKMALEFPIDIENAPYSLHGFIKVARLNELDILFLEKDYQKALKKVEQMDPSSAYYADIHVYATQLKSYLKLNDLNNAVKITNQLIANLASENTSFNILKQSHEDFIPGSILTDANILVTIGEAFHQYYGQTSEIEEKLYWMALIQFEGNLNNEILNKDLKESFDRIITKIIEIDQQQGLNKDKKLKLLQFIEQVTAHNFINNFLIKRDLAENNNMFQLVEKEQFIRAYLTQLKKEKILAKNNENDELIFEQEVKLDQVKKQLQETFQTGSQFTQPEFNTHHLTGKNIIKFQVVGDQLIKISVHGDEISYEKFNNFEYIKSNVLNFCSLIHNPQSSITDIRTLGKKLYKDLFHHDFKTNQPIIIIPDDVLFYLPFELLTHENQYLIEQHTISYALNLYSLLNPTQESPSKFKSASLFAPKYYESSSRNSIASRMGYKDIPHAKSEVKEISKIIPSKLYVGNNASKSTFKNMGKDISILHLAMHSTLNNEDPELSHLAFTDTEEDYELYISELYGYYFNADLAVLSACNTGIGELKNGESIISMHKTFTSAGFASTISSLWNAPDQSTKAVMVDFYHFLSKGLDKASALQNAKLNYLKNTEEEPLKHPFYWAGFTLTGNVDPIIFSNPTVWTSDILIYLGILTLGISYLIYNIRKKRKAIKLK